MEKGISRVQGDRLLADWKAQLPVDVASNIQRAGFNGLKNMKMTIYLTEKGYDRCQELKGYLMDLFTQHSVQIAGQTPYITIQRPPAVQEKYSEFWQNVGRSSERRQ